MPFNPHAMIISNSKTGKSTIYAKIGKRRDRVSMAGLIGFADAQRANAGDVNNGNGTYCIDEVQQEKRENVLSQFLTFLENGYAEVAVGSQLVTTRGCSTLAFIGNPKEIEESDFNPKASLLNSFRETLIRMTDNYRAFGSRVGIVLFGSEFKEIVGKRLDRKKVMKLGVLINYIIKRISKKVNRLLTNNDVVDWMDTEYHGKYKERIIKTTANIALREARDFWKGHIHGYRHCRGMAVRLAILENLADILKDKYTIEQILQSAEKHFLWLLEVNMESLANMIEIISDEVMEGLNNRILASTEPSYLRYFIITLIRHLEKNPEAKNIYTVIDELREAFLDVKENFDCQKYKRWPELSKKIANLKPGLRSVLLNDYGIQITRLNDVPALFIADKKKIEGFLTAYQMFLKNQLYQSVEKSKKNLNINYSVETIKIK
jgi:hypothetical protein